MATAMDITESEADWRYAKVGRIKGDQEIFGAPVKDGTLLWQTTVTEDQCRGQVSFLTPSPTALALDVAIGAAKAAETARGTVDYSTSQADGIDRPRKENVETLFDYFERCMVAAVFSYQSLEAYANQVISHVLKEPVALRRRRGSVWLSPEELERSASTDEKIGIVLPKALSVQSPKGTLLWEEYVTLKDVRDSTVHLKSEDHYVRGRLDRDSLYYRFLNQSPMEFPRTATRVIRHFCGNRPDRWLEAAESRLEEASAR